jgi:glutamyl-tRNA reductase
LASRYGAEALPLTEKQRILQLSDVVISATSAPHSIIHRADFTPSDRKMLLFDLANPKDIDDDVRYLIGKRLFNLEQIERKAKQNIEARKGAVAHCERIIEEEIAELQRWEAFRHKYRKEVTA